MLQIHPQVVWLLFASPVLAAQHMQLDAVQWVSKRDSALPLLIENNCGETIWPAILTQAGNGPSTSGFSLGSGASKRLSVSENWQGRVWGRTNCSFNSAGTGPNPTGGSKGNGAACSTGDCGGVLQCNLAGWPPATLAEFNYMSVSGQAYYDISLVDGYNLAVGIFNMFDESKNKSLEAIPPNLTNPVCIATASLLTSPGSAPNKYYHSNSTYPTPLEQKVSSSAVSRWCPWDLQVYPPNKPGDGVYPYPDDNIARPDFDPCYSACAKSGAPSDCCTGSYNDPNVCKPGEYSQNAKAVCPDAYSFAYDDITSTFIVPQGGGFGVTFCPSGRSSNILATMGDELHSVASRGYLDAAQYAVTRNNTYLQTSNGTILLSSRVGGPVWALLIAVIALLSLL